MDIKRKDKRILKKNALIAATIPIILMLIPMGLIIVAAIVEHMPLFTLFLLFPLIGIIGTLLALRERLKEIEGGELDEASKY